MSFNKIVSYLFHPILLATISAILFFKLTPKYIDESVQLKISSVIFLSTFIIPIIFLSILKKKGNIESFHLTNTKERKYPLLFFSILHFILGYRLLQLTIIVILAHTYISVSIALLIAYLLLFKSVKISLHTIGIGIMTGFLILISIFYKINLIILIALMFAIFGIVANARLKLKAHSLIEIYSGFIIGISLELLTYYFL